jgi:hypothetical protein
MLKIIPPAHRKIAGSGDISAIADLRALGYNYNTANALRLAHNEQQTRSTNHD